jgi:hypothetical protein
MKYTKSKKADEKIEKDLEIVKKVIVDELNPISIIMFGGFGHGGGSYTFVGKEILPLNDYDMYVITKQKISGEELERIGEECSKALNRGGKEIVENFEEQYDENEFFHVDLHNLTYSSLKKLYPTQRTFDLKTSLVVYGEDVLNFIPDVEISKSDALRLLFNKLDHFVIAEGNDKKIKNIYAVKGFTDLCSSILIFEGKYVSRYEDRVEIFRKLDIPNKLKKFVEKATIAKLKNGYDVKDTGKFFDESKYWVEWTLKKLLKEHLGIKSDDWKVICKKMYQKLPFIYFNDYLGSKYLFFGQYYLNVRFFLEGLRKREFLLRSLLRWRDAGLILAISLMLYSFDEEGEAKKYLKKLAREKNDLKKSILQFYSIYYLQKLV